MQMRNMGSTSILTEEAHDERLPVPDLPYVLVVDDDEAIISVVMFLLETEGHAAFGISNSQKVIPFLQQAKAQRLPSVILLDLMMPGLSGYEIAAQLAQYEQFAAIPLIIMTADSRVRDIHAIPGALDLVNKPFQIDILLSKLEPYLLPPATP